MMLPYDICIGQDNIRTGNPFYHHTEYRQNLRVLLSNARLWNRGGHGVRGLRSPRGCRPRLTYSRLLPGVALRLPPANVKRHYVALVVAPCGRVVLVSSTPAGREGLFGFFDLEFLAFADGAVGFETVQLEQGIDGNTVFLGDFRQRVARTDGVHDVVALG